MRKFIDGRYMLTDCTATAARIGDTTLQRAIYYHDINDTNCAGDAVIFGYTLDDINSLDDLQAIDASAFSTDEADLRTADQFINEDYENPYSDYSSILLMVMLQEDNFTLHVAVDILKRIQSSYEHKHLTPDHYWELCRRVFKAGHDFFTES